MQLFATGNLTSVKFHPAILRCFSTNPPNNIAISANDHLFPDFSKRSLPLYSRAARPVKVFNIPGLVDYSVAWNWQRALISHKIQRAKAIERGGADRNTEIQDCLLLLEHSPVYTLGRGATLSNVKFTQLITNQADNSLHPIQTKLEINAQEAANNSNAHSMLHFPVDSPVPHLFRVDRGGEVTFHGPGQLVIYPIFNLNYYKLDLHWYVMQLQLSIRQSLRDLGLEKHHFVEEPKYTGIWLNPDSSTAKQNEKVCAIGINCSRWHVNHGAALNVHTDLQYFQQIIPCGIDESSKKVNNIADYLKRSQPQQLMHLVKAKLVENFERVFNIKCEVNDASPQQFLQQLHTGYLGDKPMSQQQQQY
jgi:lipoyl(octanoyl) transferase